MCCPKHVETEHKWNIYLLTASGWCFSFKWHQNILTIIVVNDFEVVWVWNNCIRCLYCFVIPGYTNNKHLSHFIALIAFFRHNLHVHDPRDFRLQPQCKSELRSSGSYAAYSGNSAPTFQDNLSVPSSWVVLKEGTDGMSRNVRKNYHSTLRKIPEERRWHSVLPLRQFPLIYTNV